MGGTVVGCDRLRRGARQGGYGDPTGPLYLLHNGATWLMVTGALFVLMWPWPTPPAVLPGLPGLRGGWGSGTSADYFARRALIAAVLAGVAGRGRRDRAPRRLPRYVYDGLTSWPGRRAGRRLSRLWPGRLGAVANGSVSGAASGGRGGRGTRRDLGGYFAAAFPYILPTSLTISGGAGAPASLTGVIVVFAAAAITVIPSLLPALHALAAPGARVGGAPWFTS